MCCTLTAVSTGAGVDKMVLKCGSWVALDREARGPAAECFACWQTPPQEAVTTTVGRRAGAGAGLVAEPRQGLYLTAGKDI